MPWCKQPYFREKDFIKIHWVLDLTGNSILGILEEVSLKNGEDELEDQTNNCQQFLAVNMRWGEL